MPSESSSWDERYHQPGFLCGREPCDFLREHVAALPRGRALDLAMGEGRNAVFLAERGWQVTGIERSEPALAKGRELAAARGVTLDLREADLEHYELEREAYDVVLCFYYLQRSLFEPIKRALRAGGALLFETYTVNQLQFAKGPRNPAHLLALNELYWAFRDLRLTFYRERVKDEKAVASLLAFKPPVS